MNWAAVAMWINTCACRRVILMILACVLAAPVTGCTSLQTIPPAAEPSAAVFGDVQAGDTVVVHLNDGRQLQLTVARVEGDVLVSAEGVRYARRDITHLQRRQISPGRTALAVTAGALGVWAGVVILVAGAVAVLW